MARVPLHLVLNTFPAQNLFSFVLLIHPLWRVAIFTLLFLTFARLASGPANQIFTHLESLFSQFARHSNLVLLSLFFGVIAIRVAVLPLLHVPVPGIHDEFSYLLMGDTFAHGRLANPPHPMWLSFETFHVNWLPTYSSIYPPAQGAILAFGQLLGSPWIGVLFSTAAMCSAIAWMLQAWMPSRWALLGGALAVIKFGVASYWMNSYWGGAAAAIGGALVLGTLGRIPRRANAWHGALLGLGVAILANSRPYEGMLFCIPAAVWFIWWLARTNKIPSAHNAASSPARIAVLISALIVLATSAAFMGYYNWRLTGNALLMPHALRTRTYHSSALFLWEQSRPPLHYNNQQFEDFYNGWERENYRHTWQDVWRVSTEKIDRGNHTFFWWGAILLAPGVPFVLRDKKMRLLLTTVFIGALGIFAVIWSFAHYAAPFTCVIIALVVQSLRHLRAMTVGTFALGRWLSRAAILLLLIETALYPAHRQCDPLAWTCQGDPSRAAIQNRLSHEPGKHLIIVRYEPDHNIHDEWVYNGAEIDTAKVLWARELDVNQNSKLLAYFRDRTVWLVDPDNDNTELIPYSPPESLEPLAEERR
jgi:hypothetical protein